MSKEAIKILEAKCLDLQLEIEEVREENRKMAHYLKMARAELAAIHADRNYPDLKVVG